MIEVLCLQVLDIGCATGRHAFEMAKEFNEVVAFDFSAAFVEACKKMQRVSPKQP